MHPKNVSSPTSFHKLRWICAPAQSCLLHDPFFYLTLKPQKAAPQTFVFCLSCLALWKERYLSHRTCTLFTGQRVQVWPKTGFLFQAEEPTGDSCSLFEFRNLHWCECHSQAFSFLCDDLFTRWGPRLWIFLCSIPKAWDIVGAQKNLPRVWADLCASLESYWLTQYLSFW